MAWAYKTSSAANNGNGGGGGSFSITLGAAVSVGDRVMLAIAAWQTTTNPALNSTYTDSLGNTYALDVSTGVFTQDPGFPQIVAIYSATVTTGGTPSITVSGTFDGAAAAVAAYSGLSTAAGAGAAIDVSSTGNGNSSSASSGTTSATTAASELVIGIYGDDGFNQPLTVHSGTQRTYRQSSTDDSIGLFDADSGTSGTTQSMTAGPAIATPWGMICAVYKLVGAVSPPIGGALVVRQAVKRGGYI